MSLDDLTTFQKTQMMFHDGREGKGDGKDKKGTGKKEEERKGERLYPPCRRWKDKGQGFQKCYNWGKAVRFSSDCRLPRAHRAQNLWEHNDYQQFEESDYVYDDEWYERDYDDSVTERLLLDCGTEYCVCPRSYAPECSIEPLDDQDMQSQSREILWFAMHLFRRSAWQHYAISATA